MTFPGKCGWHIGVAACAGPAGRYHPVCCSYLADPIVGSVGSAPDCLPGVGVFMLVVCFLPDARELLLSINSRNDMWCIVVQDAVVFIEVTCT